MCPTTKLLLFICKNPHWSGLGSFKDTDLCFERIVNDAIVNLDRFLLHTTESLNTALLVGVLRCKRLFVAVWRVAIETVIWSFEVRSGIVLRIEINFRLIRRSLKFPEKSFGFGLNLLS